MIVKPSFAKCDWGEKNAFDEEKVKNIYIINAIYYKIYDLA